MIWTVIQISLRRLLHSRVELLLTFVVPLAFFSIFAVIFGGGVGADTAPRIKVLAVDLVGTPESQAALEHLRQSPGLRFMTIAGRNRTANQPAVTGDPVSRDPVAVDEAVARNLVRRGEVSVAILLETPGQPNARKENPGGRITARLLSDSSDVIAGQLVSAVVRQAVAAVNQRVAAAEMQVRYQSESDPVPAGLRPQPPDQPQPIGAALASEAPAVTIEDVLRGDNAKPVVSMYAAGIAVMFLLFGATGGGGVLLEEQENRTLDRLFATQLTMDQLLLGKWTYLTALGVLQTTLMFLWGQWVFGIDLLGHWQGFVTMTLVTAAAAASFGLLLATLCRTRNQLNGLSVIVVLTMSALGGSMVPRYLMSENLQRAGLWTFNAWALDGYNKVFWRDLPISDLWPQMSVLMISGFGFLMAARWLAVRWETH